MKFDVISFGSAIVDIFLQSKEFKLEKINGQPSICQVYGDKLEVSDKSICPGGGGINTAVSFSRQGLRTAVVARMGQDLFGKLILNQLGKEQVKMDLVAQQDKETDLSVVLLGPDGERTILVCRGDTRLENNDIHWDKLNAKWFYLASLEGNLDLVEEIIVFAKKNNIKVAWNPGKKELENKKRVLTSASDIQILILNLQEAVLLVDNNFEKLKADYVVITKGKDGADLYYQGDKFYLPAIKTQAVDQTGAGDAFGSTFVAGLIKRLTVEESFSLAMKNSASVVEQIGAQTGLLKVS